MARAHTKMEAFSAFARRFPVLLGVPLTWGHMDAYKHLNNVSYIRLLESSRLEHFRELMRRADPAALDREAFLNGSSSAGPILQSISCRFRAPLTFPDALCIGSSVTAVGDLRFSMAHAVFSHKLGAIAAEGAGEVVLYDYKQLRKAREFPPPLREAIGAVEASAASRGAEELAALFASTGGGQRHELI